MIITPFNENDVVSSFAHQVADVVVVAPCVFHVNLFARSFGSVYADVQDVVTYESLGIVFKLRTITTQRKSRGIAK